MPQLYWLKQLCTKTSWARLPHGVEFSGNLDSQHVPSCRATVSCFGAHCCLAEPWCRSTLVLILPPEPQKFTIWSYILDGLLFHDFFIFLTKFVDFIMAFSGKSSVKLSSCSVNTLVYNHSLPSPSLLWSSLHEIHLLNWCH